MNEISPEGGFETGPNGASQRVYRGIMSDLEALRMVPGQRLIETDLAQRFGVGRNAVREAIQRLVTRGVVDPSRNKSPSLRLLDLAEAHEILDVAAVMTGLAARTAAVAFDKRRHAAVLDAAMEALDRISPDSEIAHFAQARRLLYRAILTVGGNRELQRLFPAIGIHIIYAQFPSPLLQRARMVDYRSICEAILAGDAELAEKAANEHVENVRRLLPVASSDAISRRG